MRPRCLDCSASFAARALESCTSVVAQIALMYCLEPELHGLCSSKKTSRIRSYDRTEGSNVILIDSVWSPIERYVGEAVDPPVYPTTVSTTPAMSSKVAWGFQNQPSASTAIS
eukprot:Amastigsp_a4353_42.p2 type:complete len:113 gc:universal Amastigsp_a4353_42:192-530(+)